MAEVEQGSLRAETRWNLLFIREPGGGARERHNSCFEGGMCIQEAVKRRVIVFD